MKILIYDINYAPELTGVGKYTGEMGAWLKQRGHTVQVITAMPYYPEWAIHERYKGRMWFTEIIDGVTVNRCPLYVPEKATALKRIIHEFSFILSSLYYWLPIFFSKQYDVVICVAPPFHVGFLPVLYSLFRNVPLWMHLQDLQIDVAKELDMLKNKKFLYFLFRIEKFILKRCMSVSTISEGMIRKTADKKIIQSSCKLFPNWVDEQHVKPLPPAQSLRAELGLCDTDKVVLYSGSLGEKQGLELIIKAAHSFSNNKQVKFLICGSGSYKLHLETMAQQYGLTNVLFHSLQPYEKLPAILATADIHLVLQKKSVSDLVLPSKLISILSAGGCALVSAVPGTNLHDIIYRHQMGILIDPESVDALFNGIKLALESDLSTYKQNARRYAELHLSKEAILGKFENDLLQLHSSVTRPLKFPVAKSLPHTNSPLA